MANSIEPRVNYTAGLTPQATLNGTIGTIVYASNYNDLDNKPQINNVELRGNKTAHDLGLATPEDITVTSVNNQTGDVELSGSNLNYDSTYTINNKIDDLQSQISSSGVLSVNGKIGVVTLDGTDINYSAGVTLNQKINAVEAEIPTVDYPVTSVNNKTGAVVLDATDIEYSSGTSIKTQIDTVAGDIPTTYVESINGDSGAVTLTGADLTLGTSADPSTIAGAVGDLTTLTTTDKSSLVGAVNEVVGDTYTKSEVDTALNNKTDKNTVNNYALSSSNPITIWQTGAYHAFLIVGFVQGIGVVTLLAKIINSTTSVIDFVTGSAFSNANLTFAYNPTTKAFVIQTPQSGASNLTIIRGGSA